ncbi:MULTISPECIES: TetR/AcrR family transcriptional regulator [unclassified Pseudactinotalea]|uniref:TetR/AcrR family transcriptional regulator n=1 Tax=unclassified Pseudactinotalea TaxID=2649176 RepID=UPI00128BE2F3|nr:MULTISPECIES: TetR/AcrR family transcriptional regulator [unclassified Pseudactinotalea]MPV49150.1 TetR family transcriptional regulator [Pseudactinotalea sp. HY160]QGH68175.1 TetR family transcriptional regulator [Pseudactinotalea sp. HY158]
MPRPPTARRRALDAFVDLVVECGERAATLEAVAKAAGISKGGLLYHFGSKDALVTGLIEHLTRLTEEDVAEMRADPDGATAHILRTSAEFDSEFEPAYIAAVNLAQAGYAEARAALAAADEAWREAVLEEVGDEAVARAVVLISDGIYAHAAIHGGPTGHDIAELRGLVAELLEARRG